MIEIKNLSKRYGDIEAVKGVDFSVEGGEVFCLLGSNGAGKTTIIKILIGLLESTGGTALINGKNIRDDVKSKTLFGYLPEQPHLYDRLTGREFLDIMGTLKGVEEGRLNEKIDRWSKELELDQRLDSEMGAYSKGMKQKLLFINAILHDPPNLVFDEPTVGLDPRYSQHMKRKISEFSKEGKAVLMTTHITSVAEDIADTVGIIDRGRLLTIGTPAELMERTETGTLEKAFVGVIDDERRSS
ncbi:MAG: ABC transporter ATP-binding protein [Candidatus Thermoplasmatota archaeon]